MLYRNIAVFAGSMEILGNYQELFKPTNYQILMTAASIGEALSQVSELQNSGIPVVLVHMLDLIRDTNGDMVCSLIKDRALGTKTVLRYRYLPLKKADFSHPQDVILNSDKSLLTFLDTVYESLESKT